MLQYRAFSTDADFSTTTTLAVDVAGKVKLREHPHSIVRGDVVTFAGKVLGQPIPQPGGKLVSIEVRLGNRWVPFDSTHTDPSGAFKLRERFSHQGPGIYHFRVSAPQESSYPYDSAASNVVKLQIH